MTLQEISFNFAKHGYRLITELKEDGYYLWELIPHGDNSISDPIGNCFKKSGRVKAIDICYELTKLMYETL